MYDNVRNTWTADHLMPVLVVRYGAAAFSATEGILYGGQDENGVRRSEVFLYNMETGFKLVATGDGNWYYPQCKAKLLATTGKKVVICGSGEFNRTGYYKYQHVHVYYPDTQTFGPRPEWVLPPLTGRFHIIGTIAGRLFCVSGQSVYEFRDEAKTPEGYHWHRLDLDVIDSFVDSMMVGASAIRMKNG